MSEALQTQVERGPGVGRSRLRSLSRTVRLLGSWAIALALGLVVSGCSLLPQSVVGRITPAAIPASGLRLVVEAPPELQTLLEKYLDLARLQALRGNEEIDDTEWSRLAAAAPAQARELLQTEGYFDAEVSVRHNLDSSGDLTLQRVTLTVRVGPRTQVSSVQIEQIGRAHV